MGQISVELDLLNAWELAATRKSMMCQDEVKRISITALVDTGALYFAINENIQEMLQFPVLGKKEFQLANGENIWCDFVHDVGIKFKNRECIVNAIVLPGNAEPLLGALPMEEMDVLIDPRRQELIVNPDHPLYPVFKMK